MENASKALLIAGSVLIAILLIAFGMRIFKQTEGTTDSLGESMQATEIATFNSKFTSYAGPNKSAAQVKALANIVIASNATNQLHKVTFEGSDDATTITSTAASKTGVSYTIDLVYDNNYVIGVDITP